MFSSIRQLISSTGCYSVGDHAYTGYQNEGYIRSNICSKEASAAAAWNQMIARVQVEVRRACRAGLAADLRTNPEQYFPFTRAKLEMFRNDNVSTAFYRQLIGGVDYRAKTTWCEDEVTFLAAKLVRELFDELQSVERQSEDSK